MNFQKRLEKLKVKKYNTIIEFNHQADKITEVLNLDNIMNSIDDIEGEIENLIILKKESNIALNMLTLYMANKEAFIFMKNIYEAKDNIEFEKPSYFIEHVTDQTKNMTSKQNNNLLISIISMITGDTFDESKNRLGELK